VKLRAAAARKARVSEAALEGSWAAMLSAKPSILEAWASWMSDSQSERVKAGTLPTCDSGGGC
jgi:hypothetical protein